MAVGRRPKGDEGSSHKARSRTNRGGSLANGEISRYLRKGGCQGFPQGRVGTNWPSGQSCRDGKGERSSQSFDPPAQRAICRDTPGSHSERWTHRGRVLVIALRRKANDGMTSCADEGILRRQLPQIMPGGSDLRIGTWGLKIDHLVMAITRLTSNSLRASTDDR